MAPTQIEPSSELSVHMPLSRRTMLRASALVSAAVAARSALPGTPALAATSATETFPPRFASPGAGQRAGFRWWWPHGLVDPAEIARQVDQVADAGFGLLEIADVHHSISAPLDPEGHGWGTPAWREAVEAALTRAQQRGIRIDMTIGPSWPAAVPTITPDDERAAQELAHGLTELAAGQTYDAPAPTPAVAPSSGVTQQRLVRVQAARIIGRPLKKPIVLDLQSVQDLTPTLSGDHLTWTAPADGEWVVVSYWSRGSGQRTERGPHTVPESWVVDHFSEAASQAVFSYWDEAVLTPRIRELLKSTGGNVFEDSLEMETHATIWTCDFLERFLERAGYDLAPFLPAVVELNEKYVFDFDAATSAKVRFDVADVFGQLHVDRHVRPVQAWARGLGLGLRIQPYGIENDALATAAILDVPEAESLGFKNLDDYRILASGRDIAGRKVLSCESACYNGGAYNTTWQKALGTLGSIMAGGVSQHVLHGYPYRDAPGAAWPGFAAFSPYDGNPGFGEAWGPRMPSWRHVRPVADHLARTQMILQAGLPRTDVVMFRQRGWAATGIGAYYFTNDGIPVGWSHGFISDGAMQVVEPTVRDGRLYPDGPAYKAMVLVGDPFAGRETTLPLNTARRLRALGAKGLRVVVVGDWSGVRATGLATPEENAEVQSLFSELLDLPTTVVVPDDASIPTGLAALGVTREVEHEKSTLMHVHRHDGNVDYFYVANARHAENRKITRVEQDVWFTSTVKNAVPYWLDAWTGQLQRVAVYEQVGRRFRVRVALNPGESALLAIGDRTWLDDEQGRGLNATSSDADSVRFVGPQLFVRSAAGGNLRTSLVNGKTVTTKLAPAPATVTPSAWELEVEDWTPGAQPWQTEVTTRTVGLTVLAPWTVVAGLEDVSGIGRYRTTLEIPDSWTPDVGAYLELGSVFDTFKVTLNGEPLPAVSPLVTRIDLGKRLRPGSNVLVIEVSTTLFNRLRTTNPDVFGRSARQNYGLLGPVTIVPYREAKVS